MGVIKNARKQPGYVQVYNEVLEDTRLSWRAKGLLAYLTSKPENWQIQEKDLYNKSFDGFDSIRSAIKELKSCGYMQTLTSKTESNKFSGRESFVMDIPLFDEGYRDPQNFSKEYSEKEVLLKENPVIKKR